MHVQLATHNNGQGAEVLTRQGLRLPQVVLKRLRDARIYCQPTVSIEHQNLAKKYVLRGVESGGAVAALGAYSTFVGEDGEPLAWLQRVDSIEVNGVHAIVLAPVLVRLEMLRIERTYDLLITRHSLTESVKGMRPQLVSSALFYGRRGSLEMELWGKDAEFRGTVCPAFYTRAGEAVTLPEILQPAVAAITAAVCCLGCRHCHLLSPRMSHQLTDCVPQASEESGRGMFTKGQMASDLHSVAEVLSDPAASLWLTTTLRSALLCDPVDAANDCEFLARLLARRCEQLLSDIKDSSVG